MGIFHIVTNYMGILKKRFYDARKMFSLKLQLLPKDQLNKPRKAKVIKEEYNNTKYFITFTSIVDNGRIECLTKNEFTN